MNDVVTVLLQNVRRAYSSIMFVAVLFSCFKPHQEKIHAQDMIVVNGQAIQNNPDALLAVRVSATTRYLNSQRSFAKLACQLTDDQVEQLAKLDKAWIEDQCKKGVKAKDNKQAGGGFLQAIRIAGGAEPIAPRIAGQETDTTIRSVKSEIDKQIALVINEEQSKLLKAESEAREQFRSEASAEFTIALLERHMYLNEDQIDQLSKSLPGRINRQLGWLTMIQNKQFIPTIPQKLLASVLTENQLKLIRGLQQNDFLGQEMNLMQMFGQQADDVVEFVER